MDYYFNNIKFNSQSLVLTQDNQPLAIRNNEARLLAFFLANPDQVYSKDAILENVWAGKVVSEQAVFQAISNLRVLFGENAIKTYPKKGYQWQIPVQVAEPSVIADKPAFTNATPTSVVAWPYWYWLLALCVSACLVIALLHYQSAPQSTTISTPIVLVPFAQQQTTSANVAQQLQTTFIGRAQQHKKFVVHQMAGDAPRYQIAAAPRYFLERYQSSTGAKLLVTGSIREHDQALYLAFIVQGHSNQWRGYLTGHSIDELAGKLESLLNKIAPINVLWEASDRRLVNAQLQILHSENPEDLTIHHQLIENLLYMGDLNSVKIQAEELESRARQAGDIPYQSLALLMQMHAGFQSLSGEKRLELLDSSVMLAESIDDVVLQSYLMERYAVVYYELKNFAALEEKLLRALELAESSPEQYLQVLRILSIFSFKFHHEDKRDEYLRRARAVVDEYKLPGEVHAQLDDIAGMYTNDNRQKEFFYRAAIDRFKPEDNVWFKESAQRHLVDLYIQEERWDDAMAVLAPERELSGAELFMQAKVYFKQNEIDQAQTKAEAAFKKANLQGEYVASLDSALLLAQVYKKIKAPDLQKNMREFVEKNALESWKKEKQVLLDELRL